VPYGFEYAESYYLENSCPNSWEYKSSGVWKDGEWTRTMDITVRDCNTLEPKEYWREVYRFNEKKQKTEWTSYKIEGQNHTNYYSSKFKYDDQGREIERLDEWDNKKSKFIQSYDQRGNYQIAKYEMNEGTWIQTCKTITELTADGSYLYTFQFFRDGQWKNSWRDKYAYDVQGRVILNQEEHWDDTQQEWSITDYRKTKYYMNELVSEAEYFSKDIGGGKWQNTYDKNNSLIYNESLKCSNFSDCNNGKYSFNFKAYYKSGDNSAIDYFTSYRHTGNEWVRFDSVANKYNERGEIEESFWRMYEGNFPEKIDLQERHLFSYEEFIATGIEPLENKNILYPNPASNFIYADLSESELGSFKMRDINSRNINLSFNITEAGSYSADVNALPNGIYFCSFISNGKLNTYKILKN
jgi:hypothetical protein